MEKSYSASAFSFSGTRLISEEPVRFSNSSIIAKSRDNTTANGTAVAEKDAEKAREAADRCFAYEIKRHITPLQASEYERFLGTKSEELQERMKEAQEVFKRLKERE